MSSGDIPSQYDPNLGSDGGLVLEETGSDLERPSLYSVVILNDDYTPMEFVVSVLQQFFGKSRDDATHIMLHVHTRGRGVAGIFTHEIAETKAALVNEYARDHEHPLQTLVEPAE